MPARSIQRIVAAAALALAAATTAHASEPAVVLDTSDLRPDADAFVSSAQPDRNFGGDSRLWVGQRSGYGAVRSAVRWRMQDLALARAVTGAEVRLNVTDAGPAGDAGRDVVLYRIDGSWDEGGIAWNRWPSTSGGRLATARLGTGTGWQSFRSDDVTKLVKGWRLPSWHKGHHANRGLYIQGYEADGSYRGFGSRESGSRPELRLTHVADVKPPTSTMKPIPPYHTTPDRDQPGSSRIGLSWDYGDPEPATGVKLFRIYAQQGQGEWRLVSDNVERTDSHVLGINGGRYRFAVYAVDQAGNVEVPGPAEVETLVDLTPPLVSVDPLPAWSGRSIQVTWSGRDYPEGAGLEPSGLATYDAFYAIGDGGWAPLVIGTTARGAVLENAIDGLEYRFRARAIDRAGNMQPVGDAQATTRIDARPPTVAMSRVAASEQGLFTVRWEGDDHGGSGVASYDVQYAVDGGPWRDWVMATRDLERIFQGERPRFYAFRARARDAAGNEGIWPAAPQLYVAVVGPGDLPHVVNLPWNGR